MSEQDHDRDRRDPAGADIGTPEPWESWETWLCLGSIALGTGGLVILGVLVDHYLL